jgi:hypothetical protein
MDEFQAIDDRASAGHQLTIPGKFDCAKHAAHGWGPGAPGAKGETGLSALSTLPSGATESGTFGFHQHTSTEELIGEAITFSIPLATGIATSHIIYTKATTPVTHCRGPRQADAGYLCFYALEEENLTAQHFFDNPESEAEEGEVASHVGVFVQWKTSLTAASRVLGTYAITAP